MAFVLAVLAVGQLIEAWPGRAAMAHARRHARRINLELSGEQAGVVARRLGMRARVGALGSLVGVLVVWAPGAVWGVGPFADPSSGARSAAGDATSYLGPIAAMVAFFVGRSVGSAAVAWSEALRPPLPRGPRVARASRPGVGDYVAPVERVGSWLVVAVDAVLVLVLIALRGPVGLPTLPVGLTVAVVIAPAAAVALQEWLAARLVAAPQITTSSTALAWDDAMRAVTLRDVVTVTLAIGLTGPFVLLGVLSSGLTGGWPENPAVGVVDALFVALLVPAAVIALVSTALAPWRHFRRRLWPIEAPA
jgi:hypothetical protein